MNNRDYKKFGSGEYYHLYNRGNEKRDIFRETDDFNFFMKRLVSYLEPEICDDKIRMGGEILPGNSFSLVSYCLMPNHYHLLVQQNTEIPVSKLILRLCTSYSKYFNKKYKRVGGVFQDQYKMVSVDDGDYLNWLTAYIHQNPKIARLVINPEDYTWSSFSEYLGKVSGICKKEVVTGQFSSLLEYKKFVDESVDIIKQKKEIEHLLIDPLQ